MIVRSFGSLPTATSLTPQTEDCGVGGAFCFGKNFFLWDDGLGPGNRYVVDFQGRYKRAMAISRTAESLPVGNALRNSAKRLDAALLEAISEAYSKFIWDLPFCLPGPGRGKCRTIEREEQLKAALISVNDALKPYDRLETQLAPYVRKMEAEEAAAAAALMTQGTNSSSQMVVETMEPVWPKYLMYGIPAAVVLLGGAFVLLKKPKPKPAVAGYRRRRKSRR